MSTLSRALAPGRCCCHPERSRGNPRLVFVFADCRLPNAECLSLERDEEIYLMFLFDKGEQEDLNEKQKAELRRAIAALKGA